MRVVNFFFFAIVACCFMQGCSKDDVGSESPKVVYDDPLQDVDGNIYKTVKIGTQIWMAENLRTTKYSDGTPIAEVSASPAWSELESGAYCAYNNDQTDVEIYGLLYNWYVVDDSRNACPDGWRVPTDEDMSTLTNYLGGMQYAGGKLKESGLVHWSSPNSGAENLYGFAALPAGARNSNGSFGSLMNDKGNYNGIWYNKKTGTMGWMLHIVYNDKGVSASTFSAKTGASIRCVKD